MSAFKNPAARGCLVVAAIAVGVPLLIVGVVGVKTWAPLHVAGEAMEELEQNLGDEVTYTPSPSGAVPPDRMELFLQLRTTIVTACGDYGSVQKGFDSVESLEDRDPEDMQEVGGVAYSLGGAALAITPFLGEFFELRNEALLAASMSLQEYVYIYAVAYHDTLLSPETRAEIFSNDEALSPEAADLLRGCLERQATAMEEKAALEAEIAAMANDPGRLIWQDSLPDAVVASVAPYRARLDQVFCPATAGLEMESTSGRAIRIALE